MQVTRLKMHVWIGIVTVLVMLQLASCELPNDEVSLEMLYR